MFWLWTKIVGKRLEMGFRAKSSSRKLPGKTNNPAIPEVHPVLLGSPSWLAGLLFWQELAHPCANSCVSFHRPSMGAPFPPFCRVTSGLDCPSSLQNLCQENGNKTFWRTYQILAEGEDLIPAPFPVNVEDLMGKGGG